MPAEWEGYLSAAFLVTFCCLDPVQTYRSGYEGTAALDPFAKEYHIVEGPRFEITPAAYRDLRKHKNFVP